MTRLERNLLDENTKLTSEIKILERMIDLQKIQMATRSLEVESLTRDNELLRVKLKDAKK